MINKPIRALTNAEIQAQELEAFNNNSKRQELWNKKELEAQETEIEFNDIPTKRTLARKQVENFNKWFSCTIYTSPDIDQDFVGNIVDRNTVIFWKEALRMVHNVGEKKESFYVFQTREMENDGVKAIWFKSWAVLEVGTPHARDGLMVNVWGDIAQATLVKYANTEHYTPTSQSNAYIIIL